MERHGSGFTQFAQSNPKTPGYKFVFSGFGTSKKQALTDLANANNFKVVSSVTNKLDFLCGGENAGPKKIEKAEAQGVQFLNEAQFIQLIETGEIPNAT